MSQPRIKAHKMTKRVAEIEEMKLAMDRIHDVTEVEIGCPECMANRYTDQQLQRARCDIVAKFSAFLTVHFEEDGKFNKRTNTITIRVDPKESVYWFYAIRVQISCLSSFPTLKTLGLKPALSPDAPLRSDPGRGKCVAQSGDAAVRITGSLAS